MHLKSKIASGILQVPDRIEEFISLLRDHKDTVQYFDLTLETLLTRVIMPPRDEKLFVTMIMDQLTVQDKKSE